MDKYIIATIHPFVFGQEVMIYENNKCIKTIECTLDNMCTTIYKLCEEYNIDDVKFFGGQLYALKFKNEFVANKFGNKHINISIQ